MAKAPNLKEIQRRTYMSYHQDGLVDIFASVYFLSFAIGILLDFLYDFSFGVIIPGALLILVLPMWIAAKRRITVPRIGFVNFGSHGKTKITAIFIGLIVLGIGFFFAFAIFQSGAPQVLDLIIENGMIAIGIGSLVVCGLFGYSMGLKRLYIYGLLSLALFVLGHFMGIFFAYIVFALAITIMTTGVGLLIVFVRKYPLKGEKTIAE